MSALGSEIKNMARVEQFAVSRDLSGGVRFAVGDRSFCISPDEAVKMAAAILKCAGVNVEFTGGNKSSIIRANGVLPQ